MKSPGYIAIKMFLLGALLTSQVFILMSFHEREKAMQSEENSWKHPAEKELTQSVDYLSGRTVFSYIEAFTPEDAIFSCGQVDQDRWFPKLENLPYTENYTAILHGEGGQRTSRRFTSLAGAEEWLFSQGCPSTKWGRKN